MDFVEAKMLGGDDLMEWHDDSLDPPQHYVYINGDITILCNTEEDAHALFMALQKARTIRIEE
ncbi:MAG TPA: hypothetical protein VKR06_46110 [Ktedonosporobacter sp.]|nr:hypothetical protein [Ktedonosporobacter sp.]